MNILSVAFFVVLAAVISYLLGSINFAVILSKLFIKKDVRELGSGNAGMTNVVRNAGPIPGILTLVFDILKGVASCAIGRYLIFGFIYSKTGNEWLLPVYGALFCGIFCQLGHIFPIYFKFKGGKGVATTVGIMAICNWKVLIVALSIFILIFLTSKIVSLGSIPAAASLPVSMILFYESSGSRLIQCVLAAVLAIIIIAKHKDNIVRIIRGEEKPISTKKGA
ncbi:MAG: glycerol-3-phosphate 1-O-acyltransferase PlsY [Oscillospiraceae bacterium]